ncbi:sensor histidine kinase [Qipengyuania sp.]|uniref:sensor histidine kinase n=2 Tax=Qipengyuania sp. TaxID=2004515 RepID=UPI003516968E
MDGIKHGLSDEVVRRMGMLPSFFSDGPSPLVTGELWKFACSAYLDNPLPAEFKERLFVYLSRFCEARYCLIRHVGFLIGEGYVAGDAGIQPHSVDDVIELFDIALDPGETDVEDATRRLTGLPAGTAGLARGSEIERDIFYLAGRLFENPRNSQEIRFALSHALGVDRSEFLLALLAFVRTAHYWTVLHPEIRTEPDMEEVMAENPHLADLMVSTNTGATMDSGARKLASEFSELVDLRHEREQLKMAIAEREKAQDKLVVLNRELNHRVKNLFALIRSMVRQSARSEEDGRIDAEKLTARIDALGRSHALTIENEELQPVPLKGLVETVLEPHSQPGRRIYIEGSDVLVPRTALTPLGLILHELATNAVKYGGLSIEADASAKVEISWEQVDGGVTLRWTEGRGGMAPPETVRSGFGSRLKRACATQLGGPMTRTASPDKFEVEFFVPTVEDREHEPSGAGDMEGIS